MISRILVAVIAFSTGVLITSSLVKTVDSDQDTLSKENLIQSLSNASSVALECSKVLQTNTDKLSNCIKQLFECKSKMRVREGIFPPQPK